MECEALGRTPKDALRMGLRTSVECVTALDGDDRPGAMFGLFVDSMIGSQATPWFLGTDAVFDHPREMLVVGRWFIARWQEQFTHLSNIVARPNGRAIRMLKHWGADIGDEVQVHRGVEFLPFQWVAAIQAPAMAA